MHLISASVLWRSWENCGRRSSQLKGPYASDLSKGNVNTNFLTEVLYILCNDTVLQV